MAAKHPSLSAAIELVQLTKTFGNVVANHRIDFVVRKGEILALLGENGSGKTTLMNMLSGLYRPDSGCIYVKGEQVDLHSPKDAIARGIGMIHQHFKLVDVLTASENIVLGLPKKKGQNAKALSEEIRTISRRFGLDVDPDQKIYQMSVSQKQTVEILKVLYRGADVLILDEPTAVLTPQETDRLFDILRRMKAEGCAVIIITHKLNEVMAISDRITILRRGESIATVEKEKTNINELTEMMVGHKISLQIDCPQVSQRPLLAVRDLTIATDEGRRILDQVSFELQGGEILGVAGVAGSGQKELCECLAGLQRITSGKIYYQGKDVVSNSPLELIEKGVSLSFIPEDRLGMGLVGSMSIVDNLLLKQYRYQKGPFIRRAPICEQAKKLVEVLQIVTPSIFHQVRKLSGGNVQKVLLGRELASAPSLLITAYVVRGLDINSSYTIYDLLNEQKKKGVAILFVGEDLDVLMELCDRIMVLCGGRITGIVPAQSVTKEEIGLMMTGEEVRAHA